VPSVVIENPIINSPYEEPKRHYRFDDDDQITDQIVEQRRGSSYFVPIASPRKKGKQQELFDAQAQEKKTESDHVNRIRDRVALWRKREYPDVTPVTASLLRYWTDPDRRGKPLFFCQIEALETLIFITEVAKQTKYGDDWIEKRLREEAQKAGTDLFRLACKMATGTGKTVVMSMLIAWQTLNKRRYPKDNRFSDTFLVCTPGITIRDRLRVLLPSDEGNYYRLLDLVPHETLPELGTAKIVITNFHAFKRREKGDAGGLTKRILTAKNPGAFTETPEEMVNRVCRELGAQREIIVINDEAHHCYRSASGVASAPRVVEKLTAEEKREAEARDEEARLWLTGLEAVHEKIGVKAVYDMSATPFYLKGSGYPEGTLFPWVVSDFSLIDAIESGIVKIPRVPVADNAMTAEYPKYRNLWVYIREGLPKKGRGVEAVAGPPVLPQELQGAMESLYGHYKRQFAAWESDQEGRENGRTAPVFIVVCNNTSVSKLAFDWIAGHETEHQHPDGAPIVAPGQLEIFSNVRDQRWLDRPNTILVDSEQFESEEGMSLEFKKLAAHLIEEFKAECRQRFPGRDVEQITDEDLMREVLNTVGKVGKLGEHVKCVVSVSMLTEGWDANTVTHILGVRAFGTQLLCEQVVGRGLRRQSYVLNDQGFFDPEYADVYGVPFNFIPCAGLAEGRAPATPRVGSKVRAVPERLIDRPWLEITFPHVLSYRYDVPPEALTAKFDASSRVVLTTQDIPTRTVNAPIVGETVELTLEEAKAARPQTVAFQLATHLQQHHFRDKVWLFPQLLNIVRNWLGDPDGDSPYVDYGDETFVGLLLFVQKKNEVAEKLAKAIIRGSGGEKRLRADLPEFDRTGSTTGVAYDTVKSVWKTDPAKCHLNYVPEDSSWETQFVEKIERMEEVKAYVKNQSLGFKISYTFEGRPGSYYPDYILKIDDGRGMADLLNLIAEISGQELKQKQAKVETAKTLWVPAVNNERIFGRWAYLEIDNPSKVMQTIRKFLASGVA
jgi:type III restriction enzyme